MVSQGNPSAGPQGAQAAPEAAAQPQTNQQPEEDEPPPPEPFGKLASCMCASFFEAMLMQIKLLKLWLLTCALHCA